MKKNILLITLTTLFLLGMSACHTPTQSSADVDAPVSTTHMTPSNKVESPLEGGLVRNIHSTLSVPTM